MLAVTYIREGHRSGMRSLALLSLVFAVGCEAIFTDLSPDDGQVPSDAAFLDAAFSSDSATFDGATRDASSDAGETNDGGAGDTALLVDAGRATPDAGPSTPLLLSSGTFEGRGGYAAAGSVRLEEVAPGEYQVVMSDDFSSAAVPGPVVVVTPRAAIGTRLTSEDILVITLESSMIAGPGTYSFRAPSVPAEGFVFIYCEPFGVETARATMVTP